MHDREGMVNYLWLTTPFTSFEECKTECLYMGHCKGASYGIQDSAWVCKFFKSSESQYSFGGIFAEKTCPTMTATTTRAFNSTSSDVLFHCGRPNQRCVNGGRCSVTDGQCACPPQFAGFSCQHNISGLTSGCSTTCSNDAVCFSGQGQPDVCVCEPDFTGDMCQENRVQATCDAAILNISVNIIAPFDGLIFVGSDPADSACVLTRYEDRYVGMFSLRNSCGGTNATFDHQGNTVYSKQLRINFSKMYVSQLDLLYNVSCVHSSQSTTADFDFPEIEKETPEKSVTDEYKPARLTVRSNPDLAEIISPVRLGQRVYLLNYLDNENVFKGLFVEECTVSDLLNDKSLLLIQGGCPTEVAAPLFYDDASRSTSPLGVKIDMQIFKLVPNTKSLRFSCTVRMCRDAGDVSCQLVPCSSGGRKRRAAGSGVKCHLEAKNSEVKATQETETVIYLAEGPANDENFVISGTNNSSSCGVQGTKLIPTLLAVLVSLLL